MCSGGESERMIFIGQKLYGYCGGEFGRDYYDDKRIESFGADWIVVREEDGKPNFAWFYSTEQMLQFVKDYTL